MPPEVALLFGLAAGMFVMFVIWRIDRSALRSELKLAMSRLSEPVQTRTVEVPVVIRTRIRSAEEEELDNSIEDLRAEIEELEEQRRRLIEETAETSEALLTARLDATSFREEIEREAVLSTEELERALQMAFDEFIMGINGQVDRFRSGMTDVQESLDDHVHNEETSEEPPEAIETAKSSYDHILEEDYPTEDDPSEREPQA